jgi:hypothetical protein
VGAAGLRGCTSICTWLSRCADRAAGVDVGGGAAFGRCQTVDGKDWSGNGVLDPSTGMHEVSALAAVNSEGLLVCLSGVLEPY